ncbi:MAG: EamA domain-containing membrane protein RarD [Rickettsiales bacterium]|jgi:EamA domain-containing membrane protein RarD
MKKNSSGRTSFLVAIVAFIIWGLVTAYLEISSDISATIFLLVIFSITYLRQEKRIRNSKSQTIDYIKQ